MSGRKLDWMPVFFAIAACSWMPHWACHYYRLETGSSFIVGGWEFSRLDSVLSMAVYTALIGLNLISVVHSALRFWAAMASGFGHSLLGGIHIVRLMRPFRFEVFGYPWPRGASAREAGLVLAFGIVSFWVAWQTRRETRSTPARSPAQGCSDIER